MGDRTRQDVYKFNKREKLQKSRNGTRQSASPRTSNADFFQASSTTACSIFVIVNLLAAIYAPIQDCDEVFNYWEPTHYLNHGFGFETWEYSPEYAIRSWLYILVHALPGKSGSSFFSKRHFEFYFIRGILGCVCAGCETHLFSIISRAMSPRVAVFFLIAMTTASGMFHASVAYLPSSFAMYTTMMGMAAFMDTDGGLKSNIGIMWFGIGATIGWPFSAALVMPFLLGELVFARVTGNISEIAHRIVDGGVRSLVIVPLQVGIDMFFYHKMLFVPWRIVSYNIFSGSSRGPDIFGTEPWHFYVRNLFLNFNAWFMLAMCAGPVLLLTFVTQEHSIMRAPIWRSMIHTIPFYLWFAIFTAQAHKEERFMYPAYPLLCFNAAIAMHVMLFYLGRSNQVTVLRKVPAKLKLLSAIGGTLLAVTTGVLRTVATVSAYGAPLEIYKPLQTPEFTNTEGFVCLGKEWYRYPSSYFLPKKMRAAFVKSNFDGLLPGHFSEATTGFGLYPTWFVPPGMNDQSIEDPGKHTDIRHCSFFVDSHFTGSAPSALEPAYIADTKTWESDRTLYRGATLIDGFNQDSLSLARVLLSPPSRSNQPNALGMASELHYITQDQIRRCSHFLSQNLKQTLYGAVVVLLLTSFLVTKFIKRNKSLPRRATSPDLEKPTTKKASTFKAPERPPGLWTLVNFKRPDPAPYPDWDVYKTVPLPYRPFRHGLYHITMGLRSMQWDDWIELDNHYLKFHADKKRRIEERGATHCRTAPEAMDGAIELLEEFCDYLPKRYPTLYCKTEVGIDNLVTGESFNIIQRPLSEDPMQTCARLVQDDLAIMFERPDGQYYLLAGAILLAGFWRLGDKFGMPLSEIHTSGDVPGFKTKLEKGMMNFFRRVQPNGPVLRNNYFLQVDDELAWSSSIGSEDGDHTQAIGWDTAEKNKAIEHHFFRSERQSLRRLPRSGGVVFTIRTYFEPITAIAKEPGIPGRLASAVRSWGDDVAKYKGRERYQDVLLEYLDEQHRHQVERGDVSENYADEDEGRKYPF